MTHHHDEDDNGSHLVALLRACNLERRPYTEESRLVAYEVARRR